MLDGFELDDDLAEYIRETDSLSDNPEVAARTLSGCFDDDWKMEATVERVGSIMEKEGYSYDQEQTVFPESSGWSLESITTGVGTENEDTQEVGGTGSVEMVEVETDRDEYEGMWVVPPKYVDDPGDLIDDSVRTVRWMYRDGVAFGPEHTPEGGYIRERWGDVPMRDWWEYVQPHEAGTPKPSFAGPGG